MKRTPRDYQNAAVDAFFDYWAANTGNPLEALPTGTGKALIIAEFIRRAWEMYPGTRIVVMTHVKELVDQNFCTLLAQWPTAPAGVYSAGLRRKDVGRPIVFAGIDSIANAAHHFEPEIVIIDEAHLVSPKESTTYRKVIDYWLSKNPCLKVAGLTATPYRLGQGMLTEPGGLFTDLCFDMTTLEAFNWFISEGYLKKLTPKGTDTQYDISGVKISSTGDYNSKQLQAAVDQDALTRQAVSEMIAKASDRNHWLIFAAGIQHAEHVTAMLIENGISAVCVHSKIPNAARDEAVNAFKAGEFRALVNNGCFTTGFDFPGIDMIGVLRHTTSPGLWVQMLGRGTRPVWLPGYDISTREGRLACIAAGTPNCLVLDFAKNTERLGPINDVRRPKSRQKGAPGDAPAKICPVCMSYNYASARLCCECGAEFVFTPKLKTTASDRELIKGIEEAPQEIIEEWLTVETVTYSKHLPWNAKRQKGRLIPSLRVTYHCGIRAFTEWVCLEHTGVARAEAERWWLEGGGGVAPATVDDAISAADSLKQPSKIRVWLNRKNPKIMYREFL